jgi:hypothetical protein
MACAEDYSSSSTALKDSSNEPTTNRISFSPPHLETIARVSRGDGAIVVGWSEGFSPLTMIYQQKRERAARSRRKTNRSRV